mmetsp:Transcript_54755/g.120074  ORF Transcript_54755/g.120074 Transcript_54755/m.120074 type:complete len:404 (+) Transcript_54755:93-1304(+)
MGRKDSVEEMPAPSKLGAGDFGMMVEQCSVKRAGMRVAAIAGLVQACGEGVVPPEEVMRYLDTLSHALCGSASKAADEALLALKAMGLVLLTCGRHPPAALSESEFDQIFTRAAKAGRDHKSPPARGWAALLVALLGWMGCQEDARTVEAWEWFQSRIASEAAHSESWTPAEIIPFLVGWTFLALDKSKAWVRRDMAPKQGSFVNSALWRAAVSWVTNASTDVRLAAGQSLGAMFEVYHHPTEEEGTPEDPNVEREICELHSVVKTLAGQGGTAVHSVAKRDKADFRRTFRTVLAALDGENASGEVKIHLDNDKDLVLTCLESSFKYDFLKRWAGQGIKAHITNYPAAKYMLCAGREKWNTVMRERVDLSKQALAVTKKTTQLERQRDRDEKLLHLIGDAREE